MPNHLQVHANVSILFAGKVIPSRSANFLFRGGGFLRTQTCPVGVFLHLAGVLISDCARSDSLRISASRISARSVRGGHHFGESFFRHFWPSSHFFPCYSAAVTDDEAKEIAGRFARRFIGTLRLRAFASSAPHLIITTVCGF